MQHSFKHVAGGGKQMQWRITSSSGRSEQRKTDRRIIKRGIMGKAGAIQVKSPYFSSAIACPFRSITHARIDEQRKADRKYSMSDSSILDRAPSSQCLVSDPMQTHFNVHSNDHQKRRPSKQWRLGVGTRQPFAQQRYRVIQRRRFPEQAVSSSSAKKRSDQVFSVPEPTPNATDLVASNLLCSNHIQSFVQFMS
jgi:hypothetical protein